MTSAIKRLSEWYQLQCDGDWEHQYGVEISTIDNPGWRIKIDLIDMPLADKPFDDYEDKYESDREWLRCWRKENVFHAACAPCRLEDAILMFLKWAESRNVCVA